MLIRYDTIVGGCSVATWVAYVSTCLGDIGNVAIHVELWLRVLEVPLSVLEVV